MMQESSSSAKINKSFFLLVIIVFGLLLLYSLQEFFNAFLASIMFYVMFKPWMKYLVKRKKWKPSWAAVLVIVVSFLIIMLPILLFSSLLFTRVSDIISHPETINVYVEQLQTALKIELFSKENLQKIQTYAASLVSNVLNTGLSLFSSIVMMYFLMYFMLIHFGRLEAAIVYYLPFDKRKIILFGNELEIQTFSNVIGVPLIAVVQGLLSFGAFYLAGLPQPGFWGILTGFASIVPIVGTGLIWVPACVFLFINGQTLEGILVLSWCAIVMGSADNVIRFVLAKRMGDVHPIVTVLGVIMGLNYMGIPGLIFGPLMISYFLILVKIYYSTYQSPNLKPKKEEEEATLHVGVPFIYQKKFSQKRK